VRGEKEESKKGQGEDPRKAVGGTGGGLGAGRARAGRDRRKHWEGRKDHWGGFENKKKGKGILGRSRIKKWSVTQNSSLWGV